MDYIEEPFVPMEIDQVAVPLYTHVVPELRRDAAQRMEALLQENER